MKNIDGLATLLGDLDLSNALTIQAMMEVLTQQFIQHPPPWKIEYDWTHEVIASDGYCIAKCGDSAIAKKLVVWAERYSKWLGGVAEEIEKEHMS